MPPLELLRGFEAAARHRSFTRAAAELHVTQSAVSRQVRRLEAELGVRLFDRRTRALVLTDVGHTYYVEVQRLLDELLEITARVKTRRAATLLRVTTTPTFASLWLIPRLSEFQRRFPNVHVHVVAENALRELERDGYDLAIRYSPRRLAGPGATKLFDERLVPLCAPRLARRGSLRRPEDLDRFTLIHFNDLEGYAPWLSWDVWLAGNGGGRGQGKGALYFSHYDQAMRAALAGQGIALGRVPVVDDLLRDGRLAAPFGEDLAVPLQDRSYWLLQAPAAQPGKAEVLAFRAWLVENAAQSDALSGASRA
ncbi:MAG TPA: LysR substrate-binding domain-containing protein [Burkholderiales bacterium]|nr:LysR substrate-binding domain-containing protein [Burkholderiales bacterium]